MSPASGPSGTSPGALVGFVAASMLIPALLYAGRVGWALLGVMLAGALVLATRDEPFRRGLGSGVLAAVALVTMVVGTCLSIFTGL